MFRLNTEKLTRTEKENSIYMPMGTINMVDQALSDMGIKIRTRREQIPAGRENIKELTDRIDLYKFFTERSYNCRSLYVDEGRIDENLYYYRNKVTGEYEVGRKDDLLQKAKDPSVWQHTAAIVSCGDEGIKRIASVQNIIGKWGTYVFFKYDTGAFVDFCLRIISDGQSFEEMARKERESED